MSVICFISYEIHPTTWGGCGVLLDHAARQLLEAGHTVIFLLDVPATLFRQFNENDRLRLPHADCCRAYAVDDLCRDLTCSGKDIASVYQFNSLRLAHAYYRLTAQERIDYAEFFDYCGPGYYAMTRRLYGEDPTGAVLGVRVHTTVEMMDRYEATRCIDRERYGLYALERGALRLAETVLVPSRPFHEHYCRQAYGLPDDKVVVSQPPKLPFPRAQRRPDPCGPFRIAFIGRIYHLKGVDQIVHAGVLLLRRRPELQATFELIGFDNPESPFGTSYTEYLKTLIPARSRDRFVFPGQLSHEQIGERLDETLFAVFPNQVESFCYAAHEMYDAGIPLVLNDLPAFRAFFTHERNALVYDGSTEGLLAAMQRMIDEPALREQLVHPYDVATQPLGSFYAAPRAHAPLAVECTDKAERLIATVIVLQAGDANAQTRTVEALSAQTDRRFRQINLIPSEPDDEETFWWLGRSWHARSDNGAPIIATDLLTTGALAILESGDEPAPEWLARSRAVLQRRSELGFSGTWCRAEGKLVPSTLDIAPELYPFEHGSALTRALIRTDPGHLLIDLLDPNLGPLGEMGCIFAAVTRWGPGVLYPEPLIRLSGSAFRPADEHLLQYLIGRYGGAFSDRFAVLAGILQGERRLLNPDLPASGALPPAVPVEMKLRLADELGGSDLLKMGFRKLVRRIVRLGRH